jgi:hypothetical protein
MAGSRRRKKGEREEEGGWWGPQGQNGHFTPRFDTVSSENGRNGIEVKESSGDGTQVSTNFFMAYR